MKRACALIVVAVLAALFPPSQVLAAPDPGAVAAVAPVITVEVWNQPTLTTAANVRGVATVEGQPLARKKLDIVRTGLDGKVALESITTDQDGKFGFSDLASARGTTEYAVEYGGDHQVLAGKGAATTYVTGQSFELTFDPATEVPAGSPLVVSGVASSAGSVLARVKLDAKHRSESAPDYATLGQVETDAAGRFTVTVTNADAGWHDIQLSYAGNHVTEPGDATQRVTAKHAVNVVFDSATDVAVGDDIVVSGRLTKSGSAFAAAELAVQHRSADEPDYASLGKVTTGADGRFSVTVPEATAGWHDVQLSYAGDGSAKPVVAVQRVNAKHDVALTIDGPEKLPTDGSDATFTGTLTTSGGDPLVGAKVQVKRTAGPSGAPVRLSDVVTNAAGVFTFSRAESASVPVTYDLAYAGSNTHRTAAVSRVWKGVPTISVRADKSLYTYGDTAAITVTTKDPIGVAQLRLLWLAVGLPSQTVSTAAADLASHSFTFGRKAARNTTITARTSETTYWLAGLSTKRLSVRPKITESLGGSYAAEGPVKLVRTTTDPVLRATVGPNREGRCVYARVEKLADGVWKLNRRSTCIRLSSASQASYKLTGTPLPNTRYRLRFESLADSMNAAANGPWVTLRFTR